MRNQILRVQPVTLYADTVASSIPGFHNEVAVVLEDHRPVGQATPETVGRDLLPQRGVHMGPVGQDFVIVMEPHYGIRPGQVQQCPARAGASSGLDVPGISGLMAVIQFKVHGASTLRDIY